MHDCLICIFTIILGLGIPALTLICLSFVNPEKIIVMALLIIAVGFNSAIYCGFNINHIDLSPNHAGTLMGITNGISNICSLVAPLVVQFIVTNEVRKFLHTFIQLDNIPT